MNRNPTYYVPTQGLGDLIWFSRWLPPNAKIAIPSGGPWRDRVSWLCRTWLDRSEAPTAYVLPDRMDVDEDGDVVLPNGETWEPITSAPWFGLETPRRHFLKIADELKSSVVFHFRGNAAFPWDAWRSVRPFACEMMETIADDLGCEHWTCLDTLPHKTPWTEIASTIAQARFFVGVNSAPMHCALGMGIPTVMLEGGWYDPRFNVQSDDFPWRKSASQKAAINEIVKRLELALINRVIHLTGDNL